jgi:hypothetical protein
VGNDRAVASSPEHVLLPVVGELPDFDIGEVGCNVTGLTRVIIACSLTTTDDANTARGMVRITNGLAELLSI